MSDPEDKQISDWEKQQYLKEVQNRVNELSSKTNRDSKEREELSVLKRYLVIKEQKIPIEVDQIRTPVLKGYRSIKSKYKGKCKLCSVLINGGSISYWSPGEKRLICIECMKSPAVS